MKLKPVLLGFFLFSLPIASSDLFSEDHGTAETRGHGKSQVEKLPPEHFLKLLLKGNERFVHDTSNHPRQNKARVLETGGGQKPFAVVLTCSDSRLSPEILFDQGIGDLFVVRLAGNIVTPEVLGSIEYAVSHLDSTLIVVLGHEKCGAVGAALAGGVPPGHVGSLVQAIRPALKKYPCEMTEKSSCAVKSNVKLVTEQISNAKPILASMVENHSLLVVGAVYDIATGGVKLSDYMITP